MKSTGIVRRIDELGRIVLPAELRRTLDIGERETMEIFVEGTGRGNRYMTGQRAAARRPDRAAWSALPIQCQRKDSSAGAATAIA